MTLVAHVARGLAGLACVALLAFAPTVEAGRDSRNVTRKTTNVNVNKDVNVNTRKHVDIDVDVDRGYHPVGTALAVGATVAVTTAIVGSMVNTLPPTGCYPVQVGAVLYQQCGPTWYQPQYAGTTVQYVVVNPPR